MKKVNLKLVILILLTQLALGCKDDDDVKEWCIEPPCGTTVAGSVNLTILNDSESQVTALGIIVDDEVQSINLDGWDFDNKKYYTCWQVIPTINSDSQIILQYQVNGEVVIFTLNVSLINSDLVFIRINGEEIEFGDYIDCVDFI